MSDKTLTVAEVAVRLKVANKTVYTIAQNAELPWFKVRAQWRFRREDLDTWMGSQVKRPGTSEQFGAKPNASMRKGGTRR